MTRKRFIKLLMAEGISRNKAVLFAKRAGKRRSYAEVYESFLPMMRPAFKLGKITMSMEEATKAVKKFQGAFHQFF